MEQEVSATPDFAPRPQAIASCWRYKNAGASAQQNNQANAPDLSITNL